VIDAVFLKKHGLIKSLNKPFKILGDGKITKSLVIQTSRISKTAQEKIIKAGGRIEAVIERKNTEEASSTE
jgi:large subunit ribosomal protein L15